MKFLKIFCLLALIGVTIQSCSSQEDQLAKVSWNFVHDLNSEVNTIELANYFDEFQRTDSLFAGLNDYRVTFKNELDKMQFYIVKFNRSNVHAYNINLHNPIDTLVYGDLRIFFKDKEDLLIDDWDYIKSVVSNDNEDLLRMTPPPPPPPPPPMTDD